jgi:hypothetical protein
VLQEPLKQQVVQTTTEPVVGFITEFVMQEAYTAIDDNANKIAIIKCFIHNLLDGRNLLG